MREVIINGRTITVRPLTKGEESRLRKEHGINLFDLGRGQVAEAMDQVFEMVLDPTEQQWISEQTFDAAADLFEAVLAESFGAPNEAKNS
jgi:hypothetical protein